MKLYIVRHGQTWFNQIGRVQGWCDSPLTEKGIQQAIELQSYFANIPLKAGYFSGSERAGDTLDLILKDRNIPRKKDKRLKEVFFGDYEAEYVRTIFPDGVVDPKVFYAHGGELRQDAAARFLTACEDIVHQESGDVLIVSHGSVIRQVLEEISPVFFEKAKSLNSTKKLVPNCSVTILEWKEGKPVVCQLPA